MSKIQDPINQEEIKAFIHQQINDLEEYLLESAELTVSEQNAQTIIKRLKKSEELDPSFEAKHCYSFHLEDSGETLDAIGLHNDPYEAIKIAKNKMLQQLIVLQNELISNSDRQNEINQVISGGNIKH